jgi:hypothetical protein
LGSDHILEASSLAASQIGEWCDPVW